MVFILFFIELFQTGNNYNHKGENDKALTAHSPDDPSENIKIIKIEKTNEPLGKFLSTCIVQNSKRFHV